MASASSQPMSVIDHSYSVHSGTYGKNYNLLKLCNGI